MHLDFSFVFLVECQALSKATHSNYNQIHLPFICPQRFTESVITTEKNNKQVWAQHSDSDSEDHLHEKYCSKREVAIREYFDEYYNETFPTDFL